MPPLHMAGGCQKVLSILAKPGYSNLPINMNTRNWKQTGQLNLYMISGLVLYCIIVLYYPMVDVYSGLSIPVP